MGRAQRSSPSGFCLDACATPVLRFFLGDVVADKAEALQSAEKADPRVDLEWMRIRNERDLDVR